MKGKNFATIVKIKEKSKEEFLAIPKTLLRNVFRIEKMMAYGDYT